MNNEDRNLDKEQLLEQLAKLEALVDKLDVSVYERIVLSLQIINIKIKLL